MPERRARKTRPKKVPDKCARKVRPKSVPEKHAEKRAETRAETRAEKCAEKRAEKLILEIKPLIFRAGYSGGQPGVHFDALLGGEIWVDFGVRIFRASYGSISAWPDGEGGWSCGFYKDECRYSQLQRCVCKCSDEPSTAEACQEQIIVLLQVLLKEARDHSETKKLVGNCQNEQKTNVNRH